MSGIESAVSGAASAIEHPLRTAEGALSAAESAVQGLITYEANGNPEVVAKYAHAPAWHEGWEALRTTVNTTATERLAQAAHHTDTAWKALAGG